MPFANLPPIQTKYKILAATGLILLMFGGYYDNAYKPHAKKIAALESDIAGIEDTLKIVRTLEYPLANNDREIRMKIEQKKTQGAEQVDREERYLASKAKLSQVLEEITRIASDSGFSIKVLEPKDFTQKESYQSLMLDMEINAKFLNLLYFLEKIKKLPVVPETMQINILDRPNLSIRMNLAIMAK